MSLAPLLLHVVRACASAALELEDQSDYGGWRANANTPAFVYTADQTQLAAAAIPPNAPFGLAEKRDTTARPVKTLNFME